MLEGAGGVGRVAGNVPLRPAQPPLATWPACTSPTLIFKHSWVARRSTCQVLHLAPPCTPLHIALYRQALLHRMVVQGRAAWPALSASQLAASPHEQAGPALPTMFKIISIYLVAPAFYQQQVPAHSPWLPQRHAARVLVVAPFSLACVRAVPTLPNACSQRLVPTAITWRNTCPPGSPFMPCMSAICVLERPSLVGGLFASCLVFEVFKPLACFFSSTPLA